MTQEQAKLTLMEVEHLLELASVRPDIDQHWAGVPIMRLAQALLASQTALRKLEWYGWNKCCPSCGAYQRDGHIDDCELRAALLDEGDGNEQSLVELARLEHNDFVETIRQLRDDLARVEADAKKWQEEAEQIHREDTELESRYEAALARIAELEGSLRELLDEHTTDTMIPYWEGDVQHLRYGNCECSACVRARANLPAQTPSAS